MLCVRPGDLSHLVPSTFSFSAPLGFEPTRHVRTPGSWQEFELPSHAPILGPLQSMFPLPKMLSPCRSPWLLPTQSVPRTPPLPVKLFSLSCVGFFIAVLPPTCSMGSCMFLYCLSPLQITSTGQWQIISSAQYLALRKSSTNISGIFVEFNHPPQRFVPIHSPPAMYRPQELESTQMYSQIHIVGV